MTGYAERRRGYAAAVALLVTIGAMVGVVGFGVAMSSGSSDSGAGDRGAPAPGPTNSVASPAPSPTPLGRSRPVRLRISSIDVSGRLAKLGLRHDKQTMELPPRPGRAGWYERSVTPGQNGPVIIVGYAGGSRSAVFSEVRRLDAGDRVRLRRADGVAVVYRVDTIKHYPAAKLPARKVYGQVPYPAVRLIALGARESEGRPKTLVAYGHLTSVRSVKSGT